MVLYAPARNHTYMCFTFFASPRSFINMYVHPCYLLQFGASEYNISRYVPTEIITVIYMLHYVSSNYLHTKF